MPKKTLPYPAEKKQLLIETLSLVKRYVPRPHRFKLPKTVNAQIRQLHKLLSIVDLSQCDHSSIVKLIISFHTNANDEINYDDFENSATAGSTLLKRVYEYWQTHDYYIMVPLLITLIEQYYPALKKLRRLRNRESFVSTAHEAFSILLQLGKENLPLDLQDQIARCFLNQYYIEQQKPGFSSTSWLEAMIPFLCNPDIENLFLSACDTYDHGNETEADWDLVGNPALAVMWKYYKQKHPGSARSYAMDNMDDINVRKAFILSAVEEKNYAEAIDLCLEGCERAGLRMCEWFELLLKVATLAGNTQMICLAAEWLLGFTADFSYYELLKKHTPPTLWTEVYPQYIKNLLPKDENSNTLIRIFLAEKDLERVEEYLPFLEGWMWPDLEEQLCALCPEVMNRNFDIFIWHELKDRNPDFKDEDLFRYLERMKDRFGQKRISEVVILIKARYPRKKRINELFAKLLEYDVIT